MRPNTLDLCSSTKAHYYVPKFENSVLSVLAAAHVNAGPMLRINLHSDTCRCIVFTNINPECAVRTRVFSNFLSNSFSLVLIRVRDGDHCVYALIFPRWIGLRYQPA